MVTIVKYDNSCKILEEHDDKIIKALDYQLSYKILGAEFSKAFKGYINERGEEVTWDGRKHLLESNLRFPLGLLDRVIEFYEERHVEVLIDDQRRLVSESKPIDIITKLKNQNKYPREYQLRAVEIAKNRNRGIIRLATGAGKSITAALLTAAIGKPTIIYVIGTDLLYQFHKLFSSLFDEEIGIIGDGKCEIKRINIATIWSIGSVLGVKNLTDEDSEEEKTVKKEKFRDIKQMLLDTRLHVLDECQICSAETVQTIAHFVKAEHFFGMSASPWRDDNSDLLIEAVLGKKIIDIGARQLINDGFLVNPTIKFLTVPPYHTKKKSNYKTVYKNYITTNNVRNEMVTKGAVKLVEQGFKTLVLFQNIAHGKILEKLISKHIRCAILSGEDSITKRQEVCKQLEDGKIDCIIASKIFVAGIDLPILSGLVNAAGGKASVASLQRIGRCLRLAPGKNMAAVIDFADQAPYLMEHSERRKQILVDEGFDVIWPKNKTVDSDSSKTK